VLSPWQAVEYLKELDRHIENLSVVGIAGPGDPFANPDETLKTIQLTKAAFPDKIFCLSSNGLNLKQYIPELAELGVTHVTITMNAVEPEILSRIYSWVRHEKKVYRGIAAGQLLLKNQQECIGDLKKYGITVKINSVILLGINDEHINEVAEVVAGLGADVMNCIPVVPTRDTVFENLDKPSGTLMATVRKQAKAHLQLMTHCARCRADAAGLLGHDFTGTFKLLQEYAMRPVKPLDNRPYTAVATREGALVNMHLGEAETLYIFKQTPNGFQCVEERETPSSGSGDSRWLALAKTLNDCRAILVEGVGEKPLKILQNEGIRVVQMTGIIDMGLDGVYNGHPIKTVKKPDAFKCGDTCRGTATGCA
jgi:nitrogen fixation protein NifB